MAVGSTKTRSGTAERRQAFVQAYIANGHNATQAAIAAGYSPKTARSQGQRLLTNVDIGQALAVSARDVAAAISLETKRTVQEVARICYFDPLGLLGPDGQLLPLAQMAPEVRACISGIYFDKDTGRVTRIKFCDKNAALEKAMKHHGLYEKGNQQKPETLNLRVTFVKAPPRTIEHEPVIDGRPRILEVDR